MLRFLYQAVDANKKTISAFVDAESVAAARKKLEDEGLTDIKFFDDAFGARLRMKRAEVSGINPSVSAELGVRIRKRTGRLPGFIAFTKNNRGLLAFNLGMLAYGLYDGRPLLAAIGGASFIFMIGLFVYKSVPASLYDRVQRAMCFGEWERAVKLIDRLNVRTKSETVRFDLAVRRASISARQGRLTEGLASLEIWRAKMDDPKGKFAGRLASVYLAAGETSNYIAQMTESYSESSKDRSRAIDLALAHARFGDVTEAEILVALLNTKDLPEMHFAFIEWTKGLIFLRKNDIEHAIEALANASRILMPFSSKPLSWTTIALVHGCLSLAFARNGDKERARLFIKPVMPIFRVYADKSLAALINSEVLGQSVR